MDINTMLSPTELSRVKSLVDSVNKTLQDGKGIQSVMGKDEFLKLLLTQLTHQDPTQPLDDREFISQMASFSTLEQISNMNDDISEIFTLMRRSEALALLGRTVELPPQGEGELPVVGTVQEVTGDVYPQIMVNGTFYDFTDVQRIRS